MRDDNDTLGIADTIHELVRRYGRAPGYQTFWWQIASARIPAQRHGRGWRINRADLPAIAEILKLTDRAA
jgi:hypothetical protein